MAGWRVLVWLVVVLAVIGFLYLVRGILAPFVLAWLIAVLLDPLVKWQVDRKIPRPVAVMGLTIVFFGALAGIGFLVFPLVAKQANQVRIDVQQLTTELAEESATDNAFVRWNPAIQARPAGPLGKADEFLIANKSLLDRMGLPSSRRMLQAEFIDPQRDQISDNLRNAFNNVVAFLGAVVPQVVLLSFTPIFVIFLMLDLNLYRSRFRHWIPPGLRREVLDMAEDVGDVFKSYIRGLLVNISLYTLVIAIVLSVVGVPYSILIACIAGVLYIIPNLGGIMSLIMVYLVTAFTGTHENWFITMNSSWIFALIPALAFFITTTAWDMLVTPRVVGKSVQLNPFVAMFVVFSGGALFGLPGMMLAYPVAGVIKLTFERILAVTNSQGKKLKDLPIVPMRHQKQSS